MYTAPLPTFVQILFISALIRLGLIAYSEYHDANAVVKYTDVDYRVLTDAARFLLNKDGQGVHTAQGILGPYLNIGDPYFRDTYRYTPLLALLMTPNLTVKPSFGKVVFSVCDLLVGAMLYNLFILYFPRQSSATVLRQQALLWVSGLWLLNPMVIAISTRGSSESFLGLLVVGTLFLMMKGRHHLAAILLGLSIHWKIYPVIYGASILSYFGVFSKKVPFTASRLAQLFPKQGIIFGTISAATFAVVTASMYLIWGYPLLSHSYLYHFGRLDHRHNFSPYFYPTYLAYPGAPGKEGTAPSLLVNLLSFAPQMGLSLGSGILLGSKPSGLPFAWFVQTMIFVTFNKVCTSQYFIWYMWFLPLVLPRLRLSVRNALVMIAAWVSTQAIWLAIAYNLEFLAAQAYLPLWGASIFFFMANCMIITKIIEAV